MRSITAHGARFQADHGKQTTQGYAQATLTRKLKAGEILFVEGEPVRYYYQVVTGVMKEYSVCVDGQREISDFYAEGDFVGVCVHDEHTQTAEAVTSCSLRCLPPNTLLRRIGAAGPQESGLLVELLVGRLDRCRERSVLISRRNADQRVAGFLRFLARNARDPRAISIPMSRQDIADYLGLTVETVCRTITQFKRCGAIAMSTARTFVILDEAALEASERAFS